MIKEKGILFQPWGVQAILEDRKTQTRRINFKCNVGDHLWVRETFRYFDMNEECTHTENCNCYKFHNKILFKADEDISSEYKWKSPLFMPKIAARIWLEVTNVRKEKLQDITNNDAWAEGINEQEVNKLPYINKYGVYGSVSVFCNLWRSINGKKPGYAWKDNPTIDVIEFKRINNGKIQM